MSTFRLRAPNIYSIPSMLSIIVGLLVFLLISLRECSSDDHSSNILRSTVERYKDIALKLPISNADITKSKRDLYFSSRQNEDYKNDTQASKSYHQLLLFISITSGSLHDHLRQAARATWLLPCKVSPLCNYRFFIDTPNSYIDDNLREENATYGDITFRDECPDMFVHPSYVNYGNSPPTMIDSKTPMSVTILNETALGQRIKAKSRLERYEIPDYSNRRFYKIDWKVSFLRWIENNMIKPNFHVFVEDDSFTCTENLIFQSQILSEKMKMLGGRRGEGVGEGRGGRDAQNSKQRRRVDGSSIDESASTSTSTADTGRARGFRTGTAMYDGFDDSSTIMTSDIAELFTKHYNTAATTSTTTGTSAKTSAATTITTATTATATTTHDDMENLNCSIIRDHLSDLKVNFSTQWLSWGNSWTYFNCDWRNEILSKFSLNMNVPDVACMHGFLYEDPFLRHKASSSIIEKSDSKVAHPERVYNKRYYPDIEWTSDRPDVYQNRKDRKKALNDTLVKRHCHDHPLIFHHEAAAAAMLHYEDKDKINDNKNKNVNSNTNISDSNGRGRNDESSSGPRHMCEYMITIDKVKGANQMYELWNTAIANSYIDFSDVFINDGARGWLPFIENRIKVEEELRNEKKETKEKGGESILYSSSSSSSSISRNSRLLKEESRISKSMRRGSKATKDRSSSLSSLSKIESAKLVSNLLKRAGLPFNLEQIVRHYDDDPGLLRFISFPPKNMDAGKEEGVKKEK